ncbi:MAG: TetR family transcriptional regulator [Spirochaetaceae bacterium]|nr:MAG: TetR family transcriptional regulator [Spirochaetaceae bacterium]
MRRTKAEAAETREEIFRAGIRVFAEKGYAAGTLADVARAAGVTRGAIYWHFENKKAFLGEMVTRLTRAYDELLEIARNSGKEPAHAIELAVEQIILRFARDGEFRALQELMMITMVSQGDLLERDEQLRSPDETKAISVLADAIRRNQLHGGWSPLTALHSIEAVIMGVFMMIRDGKLDPTDEEIRQLAAFVRRGITPAAEHKGDRNA